MVLTENIDVEERNEGIPDMTVRVRGVLKRPVRICYIHTKPQVLTSMAFPVRVKGWKVTTFLKKSKAASPDAV